MGEHKIYTLTDSITNEIRYIGQTKQSLDKRLDNHIYGDNKKTHKYSWIKSLIDKGGYPIIELLELVSREEVSSVEKYWIAQFKEWGFRLCNHTDGGEVGFSLDKEARERLSMSKKGKKMPDEVKIKISESHKKRNKKLSKEQLISLQNARKSHLEKNGLSEKQIANTILLGQRNIGRKRNVLTVNKVIETRNRNRALGLHKFPPERKVKINRKSLFKIAKIGSNGSIIERYRTIREAAQMNGLNEASVSKVVSNDRNNVYGFLFKRIL